MRARCYKKFPGSKLIEIAGSPKVHFRGIPINGNPAIRPVIDLDSRLGRNDDLFAIIKIPAFIQFCLKNRP